jgi:hypothetical protein
MTTPNLLPEAFESLSTYVSAWALKTEIERNKKRRTSTMEELRTFYAALLPRMDEIIQYLNQYPLDGMPAEATRLFQLALSFMEVSPAVELIGEPDETGVFAAERFTIIEP